MVEHSAETLSKRPRQEDTADGSATNTETPTSPTQVEKQDVPPETAEAKELPPCSAPAARIRMTVSSGFYVRSLCHDLGAQVGSLAFMAELSRTRQSMFELGKNVLAYEDLEKGEDVWGPQIIRMLDEWDTLYPNGYERQAAKRQAPKLDCDAGGEGKVKDKDNNTRPLRNSSSPEA